MEKEEKARARWKVTGSPEGLAQFRSRLQSRRENTTIFINVILIVILIIVIWEAYKKFTNPIEEKAVNNDKQFTNPDKEKAVNNQSEEKVDSSAMMARQLKIRRRFISLRTSNAQTGSHCRRRQICENARQVDDHGSLPKFLL